MNVIEVNGRLTDPLPIGYEATAGALPRSIQWMPPGRHTVWPDGFDAPFDIEVTMAMAQQADDQLQRLRQLAANGRGNWPYGDFNHEDDEQSFEPLRFYWGGDDLRTGGIRLDVNWSATGGQKVQGKAYRSFSPSWRMKKDTHAFLGIGLNVGGLVNRSAFQSIQALAKGAGDEAKRKEEKMTEAEKQELTNLIAGAVKPVADQVAVLAKLPDRIAELEKKVEAKGATDAKAGNEVVVQLENRIKALETSDKTVLEANARKTVEEIGVKAGRIAPQDKDTIDFWTGAIVANAKASEALSKMPVNSALLTVVTAGATAGSAAGTAGEHEFIVKAKAFAKEHNIQDELDAQARYAGTNEGKRSYELYVNAMAARKN